MFIQSLPSWFQLDLTNNCNMKCKMCPRVTAELKNEEMKLEDYHRIIDALKGIKVDCLALTGMGEPFMHPAILDMAVHAKTQGMPVSITTNGLSINQDLAEKLIELDVDNIRFSIDQVTDLHNKDLHPYSETVLDNIKRLVRLRNGKSSSKVKINVNSVVTPGNLNHMFKIIRWCKENGVDFVNIIKMSTRVNEIQKTPILLEELYFRLYHLYASKKGIGLQSTYLNKGQAGCSFLKNFLFILATGDVSPCCHLYHYTVGNIFEQSVEEIWNGDKMVHFRESWLEICGGCNLMMWNHRDIRK